MKSIISIVGVFLRKNIEKIFIILSVICLFVSIILVYALSQREGGKIHGQEINFFNINSFYSILVILGAIFSGFGFIIIYRHTKELFIEQKEKIRNFIDELKILKDKSKSFKKQFKDLIKYQKELELDERSNVGIGLLAVSTIFWQYGNLAYFLEIYLETPWFEKINENWISEQTSILNSACFLGIVSTLVVSKEFLPKWWDGKLIKVFRRYRHIFIITLFVSILQSLLVYIDYKWINLDVFIKIPDLLFAIVTISMLWICLAAVFKERKLQFKWILTITMLLTLVAQFTDLYIAPDETFNFCAKTIGLLFKVGLLLILFSLSYSWRYYIDRKTIMLLDNFRNSIVEELKIDLVKLQMLKRQMNHAIRGSLHYLIDRVPKIMNSEDSLESASDRLKSRLIAIYYLHDELHNSKKTSLITNIADYISELCKKLQTAHGYEGDQFSIELALNQLNIIFDKARDIGIIMTELVINSVKAQRNVEESRRKITIRGNIVNNKLVLSVEDNGPGYNENEIKKGYGYQVVNQLVSGLNGTIQKFPCEHNGTKMLIEIPIEDI